MLLFFLFLCLEKIESTQIIASCKESYRKENTFSKKTRTPTFFPRIPVGKYTVIYYVPHGSSAAHQRTNTCASCRESCTHCCARLLIIPPSCRLRRAALGHPTAPRAAPRPHRPPKTPLRRRPARQRPPSDIPEAGRDPSRRAPRGGRHRVDCDDEARGASGARAARGRVDVHIVEEYGRGVVRRRLSARAPPQGRRGTRQDSPDTNGCGSPETVTGPPCQKIPPRPGGRGCTWAISSASTSSTRPCTCARGIGAIIHGILEPLRTLAARRTPTRPASGSARAARAFRPPPLAHSSRYRARRRPRTPAPPCSPARAPPGPAPASGPVGQAPGSGAEREAAAARPAWEPVAGGTGRARL